eukprot:39053-Alexandrium_andersonii.AAC.1
MQPQHAARNIAQPKSAACNLVHSHVQRTRMSPHSDNSAPARSRANEHALSAPMRSRAKTT